MGGGFFDDIMESIERSVDPNQDGNFGDHLDIISLSLGGLGNPDDSLSTAVDNAVAAGVVAVVAAGNGWQHYTNTINSPGTAKKAITVGATYKKNYEETYFKDESPRVDQITAFSSQGPVEWLESVGFNINYRSSFKPDIVAPGAFICAARYDNIFPVGEHPYFYPCLDQQHVQFAGTSMATPHVSGAVALIKQKHPDWTPEEIKMALRNTAVDADGPILATGFGRIDISKAILLENKPGIARIDTNGPIDGIIDIIGTATGNGFQGYDLYYSVGRDSLKWIYFGSGTSQVENGILYEGFDTSIFSVSINYFKLIVWDNNGEKSEDIAVFWYVGDELGVRQITSGGFNPSISGDKIVWQSYRNGNYDIYMYDLSFPIGKEWQITFDGSFKFGPAISGDKIVWSVGNIYMYDLSTKEERQITTTGQSRNPSISGDKIVWEDSRNGNLDIYMYDLSTGNERQITTDTNGQFSPSISGDKIVWYDGRNGNWDIYMYDLSTGNERQITTDTHWQVNPSISGDKIVWEDDRNGKMEDWDIYMYDLSTGEERLITSNYFGQRTPFIHENKIVWEDSRNGNLDIYMYDPCGNNICEEGEADFNCAPCTSFPCPLAPCIPGTCPQDCG